MRIATGFYKLLFEVPETGEVTLFKAASVCSALEHAFTALVFWLEYSHFWANKDTMLEAVEKAGFGLENFVSCMNSCKFMAETSLLFVVLDLSISYACLSLSRRAREERPLKYFYIFIQYFAHHLSMYLLAILRPYASFGVLESDLFDISSISFQSLLMFYPFFALNSYTLASSLMVIEITSISLLLYSLLGFGSSKSMRTALTQTSHLPKSFVDQVKKVCEKMGIKTEHISVVGGDSKDLIAKQSVFEDVIEIPLRAVVFFQEDALLAGVLGKVFDLHNWSPLKATLCIILIKALVFLAYAYLIYLACRKPNCDSRLEFLGAQKITYFLYFLGILLQNCLLRHFEELSDDFVSKQGLQDNAKKLFVKMDHDQESSYNPYYTGIISILSPTASFITRIERMQRASNAA